ncbi:MAG: Flp family type IVb pilin [Bdellovibrionales bacterium]|nr:Flp family type IVb pilin [Bdellovibrionales bacterium]
MKLIKNKRGQGLIEYLILVAFMAIACIGVVRAINHTVNSKFQEVDYALRGTRKTVEKEEIDSNLSRKRDLSNFMNGVGKTNGQTNN